MAYTTHDADLYFVPKQSAWPLVGSVGHGLMRVASRRKHEEKKNG